MNMKGLIQRKKEGQALSEAELRWFCDHYTQHNIPDYQVTAWLMAIYFSGLTDQEIFFLTEAMRRSGKTFHKTNNTDFFIDKHSTGGVGDKTSLALVPLVTAYFEKYPVSHRVFIPMVSGRGLGFTGGTLDKLDSVPHFNHQLSFSEGMSLLEQNGFVMMGQTEEFTPLDKKIYALRDATETVDSIPLVVCSILSKKLAESLDGLVFDVKVGRGSFLKDESKCVLLGHKLFSVARHFNLRTSVLFTDMNEPLGFYTGNALEVFEVLEWFKGKNTEPRQEDLVLQLASEMIHLASHSKVSREQACDRLRDLLKGPKVLFWYDKMFLAQGGSLTQFERTFEQKLKEVRTFSYYAEHKGVLKALNADFFGQLLTLIGGGRLTRESVIDPYVGFRFYKKLGQPVEKGEKLVDLFLSSTEFNHLEQFPWFAELRSNILVTDEPTFDVQIVHEKIL